MKALVLTELLQNKFTIRPGACDTGSEIVDYLQCTEHLKAKRNKWRPKTTWRRTEERELREFNYTGVIFIRWVGTGRVGEDLSLLHGIINLLTCCYFS